MLEAPSYIVKAAVGDTPASHKWEGTVHYNRESTPLAKRLVTMTQSAVFATGLGIAEWVYWRFDKLTKDRDAILFIEAAWAFSVDPAYTKMWDSTAEKRPHDPIGGPLFALKDVVSSLVHAERARRKSPKTSSGGPARHTVQLVFLARHVLPKARAFDEWLKSTLGRLAEANPRPAGDGFGPPVPRQALDPAFAQKTGNSAVLIDQFLRSLDSRANPYLRSPKEMTAEGFEGEPYRYSRSG